MLCCTALVAWTAKAYSHTIPVLIYHNLCPAGTEPTWPFTTSQDKLEEDLKYLLSQGYESISIEQYWASLQGKGNLPAKPIMITFDDGYENNYTLGMPVFERLEVKVSIFLIVDSVGTEPFLSWEQAQTMEQSGLVHFYSHGMRHVDHTALPLADAVSEITTSCDIIDSHLGPRSVRAFAYPYSAHNDALMGALQEEIPIQFVQSAKWYRRGRLPCLIRHEIPYETDIASKGY